MNSTIDFKEYIVGVCVRYVYSVYNIVNCRIVQL